MNNQDGPLENTHAYAWSYSNMYGCNGSCITNFQRTMLNVFSVS